MDSDMPEESVSPLEKYKLPLVAGSVGLLLVLVGVRVMFSNQSSTVEFVENTASAAGSLSELLVDVSGAVENPGVYKLDPDSRIQDALLAAGGLATSADRKWVSQHINLAGKLTDGVKLYIPEEAEVANQAVTVLGTTSNTSIDIISINNASESELETLPGVGEVTAQKIISLRPYGSLDELVSKKAVNKGTFEKIQDKISL